MNCILANFRGCVRRNTLTLNSLVTQGRYLCSENPEKTSSNKRLNIPNPTKSSHSSVRSLISWKSFAAFAIFSGGLGYFVKYQHEKKQRDLENSLKQRSYGTAKIGGDYELVDQDGNLVSNKDLLGKWLLIYFGFSHCPDICPEEMDKMGEVVDLIKKMPDVANVQPVFISVDPSRDTPSVVKEYIKEYHDDILGLTGTVEQVSKVCKVFRVYFSKGPKDDYDDYIVDHTIIHYLVDAEGNFVDYFPRSLSAVKMADRIKNYITYDAIEDQRNSSKKLFNLKSK